MSVREPLVISLPLLLLVAIGVPALAAAKNDPVLRSYVSDQCIVSDEPYYLPQTAESTSTRFFLGANLLIGKLAQAMIVGAVKGTIGRINDGAASRDTTYMVAKDINLYFADLSVSPRLLLNNQLGCVTIVAAHFQPDSVECAADYIPKEVSPETVERPESEWATLRSDNSVENVLRRANICVEGAAPSVYEARFTYSDDKTAFRLQSAGYWINALLSTNSKRATRHLFYTFEIHQPTVRSGESLLTAAWLDVGQVKAGASSDNVNDTGRSDWLRTPQVSRAAMQAYDRDTIVHQDVFGQIESLERTLVRNRRILAGLDDRLAAAGESVKARLAAEMSETEYQILKSEAVLDAKRAEYTDLPQERRQYMPVTIEIGVTEAKSEKKALLALGRFLEEKSDLIAASAVNAVGVARSFDSSDVSTTSPREQLDAARDEYYDALVESQLVPAGEAAVDGDVEQRLSLARQKYNEARLSVGMDPIE